MEADTSLIRKDFKRVAEDRILSGAFAEEFTALDRDGPGVQKKLEELFEEASHSELAEGEVRVRERLGVKTI
ncbi:hypothetical protein W97_02719 [Coniosporium apollinis CBS 100218]|uniref:Uncharacterized protein n=1 Tax=Coniosporium apollinis (strain CBS 100218) TaxID=1168221 RepID=R7YP94_CONA1|nr:uncharacterized protein W97_02719 [Coniosporium apollinis CBS 100218]EON63491.1 hypothetical protein W97_02719 [Coniosporium apollinis CBS 100218]